MLLDRNDFFIKEHVGMFKMHDVYDILDPESQEKLAEAKEIVSGFKKLLRLFINKNLMSTRVEIRDAEGTLVFSIVRPFRFFRAEVQVLNENDEKIGYFKSKILSIGGGFYVYNTRDKQVAEVQGKWTGFEYKFVTPSGEELGRVTKKWGGLAKELFTSADNYIVAIEDELSDDPEAKMLLLAAALAIDIVYKESKG